MDDFISIRDEEEVGEWGGRNLEFYLGYVNFEMHISHLNECVGDAELDFRREEFGYQLHINSTYSPGTDTSMKNAFQYLFLILMTTQDSYFLFI